MIVSCIPSAKVCFPTNISVSTFEAVNEAIDAFFPSVCCFYNWNLNVQQGCQIIYGTTYQNVK
jgi:hypothetical protein